MKFQVNDIVRIIRDSDFQGNFHEIPIGTVIRLHRVDPWIGTTSCPYYCKEHSIWLAENEIVKIGRVIKFKE